MLVLSRQIFESIHVEKGFLTLHLWHKMFFNSFNVANDPVFGSSGLFGTLLMIGAQSNSDSMDLCGRSDLFSVSLIRSATSS